MQTADRALYAAKAGGRDQVMDDSDIRFADDCQIVRDQQIVILVHRTRETVFDWDDRAIDGPVGHGIESLHAKDIQ